MKKVRSYIHEWSWVMLVVFCILGIFNTKVGILALVCMLAPSVVAIFKGRLWCGSFCPRGSFNDKILAKISLKMKKPKFLKSKWFRILFLILLMSAFTIQLVQSWGDFPAVGAVFVRMIIITTILTIILGVLYSHRTWCTICPMGTMAHYVTRLKSINNKAKNVSFDRDKCVNCNICTKGCPMEIEVLSYKTDGKVTEPDCIKCEVCINKCPKKALHIA